MVDVLTVADRFKPCGKVIEVREFGSGNINDTFLVTLDSCSERHFILQRLNPRVFRRPELVMRNMRIATDHISLRLRQGTQQARRWEVPCIFPSSNGSDYWIDSEGSFWRAVGYIHDAQSFDRIKNVDHAREVGYALGMFHTLLADLPSESLSDTLEGFHVTPLYLRHYDDVLAEEHVADKSPELNYCLRFITERREWAHVIEDAKAAGKLRPRVIHGDPKVDNIMIDNSTGQAVGIVDLDTVKPGLIHYDIGDCLRSGCNPMGEENEAWERVHFETDLCRAILQGYFSNARGFLTKEDFYYLYDCIRLIAFELGLRFFTDHLEGDVYFKVKREGQNLARALMQFKLTESIEAQEKEIKAIIRDVR